MWCTKGKVSMTQSSTQARNWRDLIRPKALLEEDRESHSESYGKFVCEPLERGFGITIGNSLRRVQLFREGVERLRRPSATVIPPRNHIAHDRIDLRSHRPWDRLVESTPRRGAPCAASTMGATIRGG